MQKKIEPAVFVTEAITTLKQNDIFKAWDILFPFGIKSRHLQRLSKQYEVTLNLKQNLTVYSPQELTSIKAAIETKLEQYSNSRISQFNSFITKDPIKNNIAWVVTAAITFWGYGLTGAWFPLLFICTIIIFLNVASRHQYHAILYKLLLNLTKEVGCQA